MCFSFLRGIRKKLSSQSEEPINGKLLIFTAPSGAGKTTIVRHLLQTFDNIAFSVSATTRPKRQHEVHGKDYYFISPESFKEKIADNAFLEWEEVYENQFYGTLKSEVERLWNEGKVVIFDIDVQGALNIKKTYPKETLAVFVKPPTPETLFERLQNRQTETKASLQKRIAKAEIELTYEEKFDTVLLNDELKDALHQAKLLVSEFISN